MSEDFEIKNKVAESGLVNFDLSALSPKGKRIGIDLKDFLFMEMILKEKDFREKVAEIDSEIYRDAYVYVYCSVDAIVPIWLPCVHRAPVEKDGEYRLLLIC